MRVMVTGGAGYIGSHTAHLLAERGDTVVIVDDLVTGSGARVSDFPLFELDLAAHNVVPALTQVLIDHKVDAVIHFAARKQVAESIVRPAWYYSQNVGGLAHVLMAMEQAAVSQLVFSSSAAVYGESSIGISETAAVAPVNPYGATKLVGEQMITAATRTWGLSAVSLRYFNVGGAGRPELGDTERLNLIPIVFDRLLAGNPPLVFGDDFETPDGTCVRDYVHVSDVADAHRTVLDGLTAESGHEIYNIGTGRGTSVLEMIAAITAATDVHIAPEIRPRREGDPAVVVALTDKIQSVRGWSARRGLAEIVSSAWESRRYFDDGH